MVGIFDGIFPTGDGAAGTTDNTTTPNIPYKSATDTFENSPLRYDIAENEVVSTVAIRAPAGTIYIGKQLGLDDAGGSLIYTNLKDDITRICLTVGFDDTGTVQQPFTTFFNPKMIRLIVQPDDSSEVISTSFTETLTGTADEFVSAIYGKIGTVAPIDDVNIKIYFDSIAEDNLIVDQNIASSEFTVDTEFNILLNPIVGQFLGQTTITVFTSDTAFALKTNAAQTSAWTAVDRQTGDTSQLINENSSVTELSDVTNAGSGSIITTIERNKLGSLTGGRYLGVFADLTALQTAYPTGVVGDNATVTSPNGNIFYWNVSVWSDSGTGYVGDMLSANNLSDVADATTARTNLNVDVAGTDNSTNVTLASDDTTQESLDITAQELSANQATTTTDGVMSSEDKTKLDNAVTATQVNNTTGYANYMDSSTSISSRTYATDTEQLLINDKAFPDGSRYPDGVTSYWDSTANKFTPDQADGNYSFTIDFVADPVSRDKRVIIKFISYGAGSGGTDVILHSRLVRLQKDDNELTQISMSFTIGVTQAVVTNGVSVTLQFEETACEVYDITCGLAKVGAEIVI